MLNNLDIEFAYEVSTIAFKEYSSSSPVMELITITESLTLYQSNYPIGISPVL